MTDLEINVRPSRYEGLLNIFDLTHDGEHIGFHVENYNGKTITPKELKEELDYTLFGLLSSSLEVPELVEKMNFHMIEQKGNHFLVIKLAPFLGLSGDDPCELDELEDLLTWLKDEALKNPVENVKLCLDRWHETQFGVISTDKELEAQLQQKFEEITNASPALKQWVENLKTGFQEVEKQSNPLSSTLDTLAIMSMNEQMELLKQRPEPLKTRNSRGIRI